MQFLSFRWFGLMLVAGALTKPGVTQPSVTRLAPETASSRSQAPAFLASCPGHGTGTLAVSGPITGVPEFHDCQRFINPDGKRYDSLYAVFVSYRLDSLVDSLRRMECDSTLKVSSGTPGTLEDTGPLLPELLPADQSCRQSANRQWNRVGLTFALIASAGGTYPTLGIQPNYNCLYLYDSNALKAKMVPVGLDDWKCLEPIDPASTTGTDLGVRRVVGFGFADHDYPAVGRWARTQKGRYYVSLKCAPYWCEVGSRNVFAGIKFLPVTFSFTGLSAEKRRVHEIPGWRDEQQLAVPAAGHLKPGPAFGVATPHPDLDSYTDESFQVGRWLPAVRMVLRGPAIAKYQSELNLDPPSQDRVANVGSLCRGGMKDCIPQSHIGDVKVCAAGTNPDDPNNFWAMIVSTRSDTLYKCIVRTVHSDLGLRIPGVVRWAWSAKDEGGWYRCGGNACCYPK